MIPFLINSLVLVLAVVIHYEMLNWLSIKVPQLTVRNRSRVLIALMGAIVAHLVEIWLFALVYFTMDRYYPSMGSLVGNFDGGLYDCFYFSISTYTTVGYGDIEPLGDIRFLAGLEALTGLVLITWTASFLFVEMQKFWTRGNSGDPD